MSPVTRQSGASTVVDAAAMTPPPTVRIASLGVGLLLTVLTGLVAMTTADHEHPPERPPSAMR